MCGGRGVCVAFVARCAHLQSAVAARGIRRCCKRRRALPNRAKRRFVAVAVAWPNCGPNVCLCPATLSVSLSPAACCKRACGMWHLWHTYKSNCHLARGTRNRLRCVSRMCPSDAVATVTAIKHQIMHAHSTSSSSCNVAHEASLRAPPVPYSRPLFPFPLPLIMRFSLKRRMQKKFTFCH